MDRRGDVLADVATRLHVSDVLFGCPREGKSHILVKNSNADTIGNVHDGDESECGQLYFVFCFLPYFFKSRYLLLSHKMSPPEGRRVKNWMEGMGLDK